MPRPSTVNTNNALLVKESPGQSERDSAVTVDRVASHSGARARSSVSVCSGCAHREGLGHRRHKLGKSRAVASPSSGVHSRSPTSVRSLGLLESCLDEKVYSCLRGASRKKGELSGTNRLASSRKGRRSSSRRNRRSLSLRNKRSPRRRNRPSPSPNNRCTSRRRNRRSSSGRKRHSPRRRNRCASTRRRNRHSSSRRSRHSLSLKNRRAPRGRTRRPSSDRKTEKFNSTDSRRIPSHESVLKTTDGVLNTSQEETLNLNESSNLSCDSNHIQIFSALSIRDAIDFNEDSDSSRDSIHRKMNNGLTTIETLDSNVNINSSSDSIQLTTGVLREAFDSHENSDSSRDSIDHTIGHVLLNISGGDAFNLTEDTQTTDEDVTEFHCHRHSVTETQQSNALKDIDEHDNLISSGPDVDRLIRAPMSDPYEGPASRPAVSGGDVSVGTSSDSTLQRINNLANILFGETIDIDLDIDSKDRDNKDVLNFFFRENFDLEYRGFNDVTEIFFGQLKENIKLSRDSTDREINEVWNVTNQETLVINDKAKMPTSVVIELTGQVSDHIPTETEQGDIAVGENRGGNFAGSRHADDTLVTSTPGGDHRVGVILGQAVSDANLPTVTSSSNVCGCLVSVIETNPGEVSECDVVGLPADASRHSVSEIYSRPVSEIDYRPVSEIDYRPVSEIDSRPVSEIGSPPVSEIESRPVEDIDLANISSSSIGGTIGLCDDIQALGKEGQTFERSNANIQKRHFTGANDDSYDLIDLPLFTGVEKINDILSGAPSVDRNEGAVGSSPVTFDVVASRESVRWTINDDARNVSSDDTFDLNDSDKASDTVALESHVTKSALVLNKVGEDVVDISDKFIASEKAGAPRLASDGRRDDHGEGVISSGSVAFDVELPVVTSFRKVGSGKDSETGMNKRSVSREARKARYCRHHCAYSRPEIIELSAGPPGLLPYDSADDVQSTGSLYARLPYDTLRTCAYNDPRRSFLSVCASRSRRRWRGRFTRRKSERDFATLDVESNHLMQASGRTVVSDRTDEEPHSRSGLTLLPTGSSSGTRYGGSEIGFFKVTKPASHVPRVERRLPKLTDNIICSVLTKAQTVSILDTLCDVPRPISPLSEKLGLLYVNVDTPPSFSGQESGTSLADPGQCSPITANSDHSFLDRCVSICIQAKREKTQPCQEAVEKLPDCLVNEPNLNPQGRYINGCLNAGDSVKTKSSLKPKQPASLKTMCFLYLAGYQFALANKRRARDTSARFTTAGHTRAEDSDDEEPDNMQRLMMRKRRLEPESCTSHEFRCKRRKVKTQNDVFSATSSAESGVINDHSNRDDDRTGKRRHYIGTDARCATLFGDKDVIDDHNNSNNDDDDVVGGEAGKRNRISDREASDAGNSERFVCDDFSTPIVLNAPDRVYHVSCRSCTRRPYPTSPLTVTNFFDPTHPDPDVYTSQSRDTNANQRAEGEVVHGVSDVEPGALPGRSVTPDWGAETEGSALAENFESMQDILARAMESAGLTEGEVGTFLALDDAIQSCLFDETTHSCTDENMCVTANNSTSDDVRASPGDDTERDDNSVSALREQYCEIGYYGHATDMKSASFTDQRFANDSLCYHTDTCVQCPADEPCAIHLNPPNDGRVEIDPLDSTHFSMTSLEGENRVGVDLGHNEVNENIPGCLGDDIASYVDELIDQARHDCVDDQGGGMPGADGVSDDELSISRDTLRLAEGLSLITSDSTICELDMKWGPGNVTSDYKVHNLSLRNCGTIRRSCCSTHHRQPQQDVSALSAAECELPERLDDSKPRDAKSFIDVVATANCFVRLERISTVPEENKECSLDGGVGFIEGTCDCALTLRLEKRKTPADGFENNTRSCDRRTTSEPGPVQSAYDNGGVNYRSSEHGADEMLTFRTGKRGAQDRLPSTFLRKVTVSDGTGSPGTAGSFTACPITARQLVCVSPGAPSDHCDRELQEAEQFKQQLVAVSPCFLSKMKRQRERAASVNCRSDLTYPLIKRPRRMPFFFRSDKLIDWVEKVSEEALDHNNSASWDGSMSGASKLKAGAKKHQPGNQGKPQAPESRLHLPRVCDKAPSLEKEKKKFERASEKMYRQHQNLHQAPSRLSLLSDGGLNPSDASVNRKYQTTGEIHQLPEICPARNMNDNQHKKHAENVCALPAMRSTSAQGSSKVLNFVKRLDTRYGDQLAHGDADTKQRLNRFCKSYLTSHGVPKSASAAPGQGDKKGKDGQVGCIPRGATDKLDDDINLLAAHNSNLSRFSTSSKDGKSSLRATPLPNDAFAPPAKKWSIEVHNVTSGQASAPNKRVLSGNKSVDGKAKACVKKMPLRPDIASSVIRLASKPASPTARLIYKIHSFEREFQKPLSIGESPQAKPASAGASRSFTTTGRFQTIRDRSIGDVKKLLSLSGAGDSTAAGLDTNWSKTCPGKDPQPIGSGANKIEKNSTVSGELSLDEFSDEHIKDDELETRQTIMASLPDLYKFPDGSDVPDIAGGSNEQCKSVPRSQYKNETDGRTDGCTDIEVKPLAQLKQMMDRSFSLEYPDFHDHGRSLNSLNTGEGKASRDMNSSLKNTSLFGRSGRSSEAPDPNAAAQNFETDGRRESRSQSVGTTSHSVNDDVKAIETKGRHPGSAPPPPSSTPNRQNDFYSIALPAGITTEFLKESKSRSEAEARPETSKELHDELDEFLDEFKDEYDREFLDEEDDYLPEFDDSDLPEDEMYNDEGQTAGGKTPRNIPDGCEVEIPDKDSGVCGVSFPTNVSRSRCEADGAATAMKTDDETAYSNGHGGDAGSRADIFKLESLDSIKKSVDDTFGPSFDELTEPGADSPAESGGGIWGDSLSYWPPYSYAPEKRTFKKLTPIQEVQDEDETSVLMDEQ
ncbi:hypothetical protein Btru_048821 [Bulinus truncatus]|nr:hypothetical protein Btru_048821 [Bulinus truncatus]